MDEDSDTKESNTKVVDLFSHGCDEGELPRQRSEIAKQVDGLKKRVLKAVEKRESLPRPFFWSLFHGEVDAIRKKKRSSGSEE